MYFLRKVPKFRALLNCRAGANLRYCADFIGSVHERERERKVSLTSRRGDGKRWKIH